MGRKRKLPVQISHPAAIPSEEEDEEEEESQAEENHSNSLTQEEEEEEVPNTAKSSKSKTKAKSKAKAPPAFTSPPPKPTIASKRGAQVESPTTGKSKRSKNEVEDDHMTKTNFMHVWTRPDEIILLQGLIRFEAEKRAYCNARDAEEFLHFVKGGLSFDASVTQLKDKVSRLKKKYAHGKWMPNQDHHERQAYDLCHTIWGDSANNTSLPTSNGIASPRVSTRSKGKLQPEVDVKASGPGQVAEKDGWNGLRMAEMEDSVMKKALELTEGEDKAQLEETWKEIDMEGLRWFLKKISFLKQQTKLVLASYHAE